MQNRLLQACLSVLLLSPLAILYSQDNQNEYEYVVKGRVINDLGQPVSRAEIILLVPWQRIKKKESSMDEIIEHYITDSEGRFLIKESSSIQIEERIMYVITSLSKDTYRLIAPSFGSFRDTERVFEGRRISIRKNHEIDVGDIPIQIYYGQVLIRLHDKNNHPLFNEESKSPDVYLRVHDYLGDVVSDGGIPNKAFLMAESAIVLALPEGKWGIEILLNYDGKTWHPIDNDMGLQMTRYSLETVVRLSPDTWQENKSPATINLTPEEARKQIKQMGFEFTESAMVERARKGNSAAVQLYLAAGVSPNARGKNGYRVLMAAASKGITQIVEMLLRNGADVNAKSNDGSTALMTAAGGYNSYIVKTLLDKGAEVNAMTDKGWTALMIAVAGNQLDDVKLLLAYGADVNIKDKEGKTAIDWARQWGRLDILKLLQLHSRPSK